VDGNEICLKNDFSVGDPPTELTITTGLLSSLQLIDKDVAVKPNTKQLVEPSKLLERLAKARREGRTQQALELARQLYKHEPIAEHLDLLRHTSLERGRQLQDRGYLKDAATVYLNAVDMDGDAEFLRELATRLAACGAAAPALQLMQRFPDSAQRPEVLGRVVDAALQQGGAGRATLPPELQDGYDRIVQAFAHAEQGADDAARAALQTIGLQSPFLEWKLLLRGLLAWYANDDAKAIENWHRLDPDRLPARLAAPIRAVIDPAYRNAQGPETQRALRQIADRLSGSSLPQALQAIRRELGQGNVPGAFQLVRSALDALRQQHPDLARRLADCFFWAILADGEPRDVDRFETLFGTITDDPEAHRLRAMLMERMDRLDEARRHWEALEKHVAASPAWPGDQGRVARALIWEHLAGMVDFDPAELMASALEPAPSRTRGSELDQTDADLQRSLQLAPERLGPYESLFHTALVCSGPEAAIKAGQRLLERFPAHAQTLMHVGVLCGKLDRHAQALVYFERALQANPLDAGVRVQLTLTHQHLALTLLKSRAKRGADQRIAQARSHFEKALSFQDNAKTLLCVRLAVLEGLDGRLDQARHWLNQALAQPDAALASAHALRAEAARAKLDKKTLAELLVLAEPRFTETELAAQLYRLIEIAATIRRYPPYPGEKKHLKEALALIKQTSFTGMNETQLAHACDLLLELGAAKQCKWAVAAGKRRFGANPLFHITQGRLLLWGKPSLAKWDDARARLHRAQALAAALPREQRDAVEVRLQQLEMELEQARPEMPFDEPFGALHDFFGAFFGGNR